MNEKMTEISIVKKLQDLLYENKLYCKFDFSVSICSGSFLIFLHEIDMVGWKIPIFDSNDPFDEVVDKAYENDEITYDLAVLMQVKYNLAMILEQVSFIKNLITETNFMENKGKVNGKL